MKVVITSQISIPNIAKKPLNQWAEINFLRQNISLMHYCAAPKYKVTTILKYLMDIYTLHPLCVLYRFIWLFSI